MTNFQLYIQFLDADGDTIQIINLDEMDTTEHDVPGNAMSYRIYGKIGGDEDVEAEA
jgi:hypothetical protein